MYRKEINIIKNESIQKGLKHGLNKGIHEGIVNGCDLGKIEVLLKVLDIFKIEYTLEQIEYLKSNIAKIDIDHILKKVIKTQGESFHRSMMHEMNKFNSCDIYNINFYLKNDEKVAELIKKFDHCQHFLQKFELFWNFIQPSTTPQSFFEDHAICHILDFSKDFYRYHIDAYCFTVKCKIIINEKNKHNQQIIQDIFLKMFQSKYCYIFNVYVFKE